MKKKHQILVYILLLCQITFAQNTYTIKGKIIDAVTQDPVPFAAIGIKKTTIGQNTDFEGNFQFKIAVIPSDSLVVSCLGYFSKTILISKDSLVQTLFIQLKPSEILLQEVKIFAGENPAFGIIRNAVKAKNDNNYKKVSAFDYKSYNKIEVDFNKINEKLRQRNITQKINKAVESIGILTDDDGNVLLPTFISESISHYYYRNNPRYTKEVIEKTNVKGIGVTDGSVISHLIGSSFQQYNFYTNQLNVLNKNFASPIADDWKLIYDYFLNDSTYFGDKFCYKIDFTPKRPQDLAFAGTIWIEKESWGIAQIDATISKDANLNFVERIKIQQELDPIGTVWFPVKNRILVDVKELTKSSAGMLLKFTNYNDDIVINKPKEVKFFSDATEIATDYNKTDDTFWQNARPESFSAKDQMAYDMIDTIKNVPTVRRLTNLTVLLSTGYKRMFRGIELGPLVYSGAVNNIEGFRIRAGFRTNTEFSTKWVLQSYVAYGTKDDAWKMGAEVTRILSRKPWTTLNLKYINDIEQVGLRNEDLGLGAIYAAYMRFNTLTRPFYENEKRFQFQREIKKGIFTTLGFRTRSFDPLYNFSYRQIPTLGDASPLKTNFNTAEFISEVTFARDELAIVTENERFSLGTTRSPTITLKYALGAKNILNSDFSYQKLTAKYSHSLNLGYLGKTYYRAEAGAILGVLPYPLLKSHLGNETPFIVNSACNLMNNFEFVSDRYAFLRYNHDFEGLFFNRFPLIKKLKWRTFTTGKFLVGSLSAQNQQINSVDNANVPQFNSLGNKPYIELGYGISNIFKFLRIEAIHRLTYQNMPNIKKFGVKFNFEIAL